MSPLYYRIFNYLRLITKTLESPFEVNGSQWRVECVFLLNLTKKNRLIYQGEAQYSRADKDSEASFSLELMNFLCTFNLNGKREEIKYSRSVFAYSHLFPSKVLSLQFLFTIIEFHVFAQIDSANGSVCKYFLFPTFPPILVNGRLVKHSSIGIRK